MIEIFGPVRSRTSRCLWTAEECGAEYKHHSLDLAAGEHRSAENLALNPNGRVPFMRNEELVLFESAAICLYMAERHPEANLLPPRPSQDAALFDQWMFWITTELEQALWTMGKHSFALPEEYRVEGMRKTALFEFDRATKVLAKALTGRGFLVGQHFTLVDLMASHTLSWARRFDIDLGSAELERYLDLHLARPAFARVLKLLS